VCEGKLRTVRRLQEEQLGIARERNFRAERREA
jgi:hypothetical protein